MLKNAVADFLENLKNEGQLAPSDSILLAISGGLDSVVMAYFFQEIGQKFGIAHCNFQLRGAESDGDEAFVRGLAGQFGVPFFCEKFDTAAFAAAQKISIQMAARALRYDFFEKTRFENGFKFVATAHHLDDSRETAMLNFFRGTGLRGLRGMLPMREKVIHPMLGLTKNELRLAAKNRFPKLIFREDRSNKTDDYDRNFLRHKILPEVEKMAPGFFEKTLDANMARARQAELLVEKIVKDIFQKSVQVLDNQWIIDTFLILEWPSPQLILGEILRPFGFRDAQIPDIFRAVLGESGRQFFSKNHKMTVDRTRLFIGPIEHKNQVFEIQNFGTKIELMDGVFSVQKGPETSKPLPRDFSKHHVFFDQKDLIFPLRLRNWQPGDRFKPSGMGGQTKKLQDFFKDQKLARPEKDRVWLLENGDGAIIWVVGMRRADLPEGTADALFQFQKNQ